WWREIWIFSPILATWAVRIASKSACGFAASARATSSQKARKDSLRPTKSVSQLISTRTPTRAPGWMDWAMTPSFASRDAFFAAVISRFVFGARLGDYLDEQGQNQAHRADGVVVAGNRIRGLVGITIRVHQRHQRNLQTAGLSDRIVLPFDIHHEHRCRKLLH